MGVSKNRGTPKSSILIRFHIINHPFCSFVFIFRCLFVVLLRGVKRLAKPATSVSLARNRGLLWKITRHRSFCTFFSSKMHYPSFSTKMWLKTALTPIFVLRLPKKTHDNPKKLGDKNTLNFKIDVFSRDIHAGANPDNWISTFDLLQNYSCLALGKNCGLLPCRVFCFDPRSGDVLQWWENSYVKNGLPWHCSGWLQQKKRGLPPKKGKLIYTYTPWKTFPRGYVYIHLHFMCELEKHC